MTVMPQAIVADFVEAAGKHMHHKSPQEFFPPQAHGSPALFFEGLIAECHMSLVHCNKPVIGDRDAIDIASQVVQDGFHAFPIRFAERVPARIPDLGLDVMENLRRRFFEPFFEAPANEQAFAQSDFPFRIFYGIKPVSFDNLS